MSPPIEKVTALVTRRTERGRDLLLFEHPYAGIQIPAGTVEAGETAQEAVLREAAEETGLSGLTVSAYLGQQEQTLPPEQRIIVKPTKIYARPDTTSFDWAYIRTGILVTVRRKTTGFTQIEYQEYDQVPDPQYVTLRILGWAPDGALIDRVRRHFFHLEFHGESEERWTVFSDNHRFSPFWAPLASLPDIIPPQDRWLEFLPGVE